MLTFKKLPITKVLDAPHIQPWPRSVIFNVYLAKYIENILNAITHN